ncbi:ATP-binding protein [Magnetospirillum sp. LM-5]|uniref:sensor histidine kinase n=1 Tax=Magnetospirillum sp. LM-5 TaxID=2681466 RepID=UPI001570A9AF|nr:ATP-binding protein [Magnetospirillum sp. LM-5]
MRTEPMIGQDGTPQVKSIAARLFRISFQYYVAIAVALTGLLAAGQYFSARADIEREMTTYQHAFAGTLGASLWAVDAAKVEAIAAGMVEIPDIEAIRIFDPTANHLFVIAIKRYDGLLVGHGDELQRQWDLLADHAAVRHAFDVTHRHATGTAILGRVELLAGRGQLFDRIKGQTGLIIAISLFKEAVLWVIFLAVGQRVLARPLRRLIAALDGARPESPEHIQFAADVEPMVSGTELAVVRDSFNALIDRVHDQRDQLVAANAQLESQVAERTQELEQANRALQAQARQLEASNAELEQFACVASHDLRQPLRMVTSYMALLDRDYGDRIDAKGHDYIGFARDGAVKMDRLIRDLLSLSRIGRTERPLVVLPFAGALDEARAALAMDVEATGATISVAVDPPMVKGDADELARLMTNLIGNAIKYRSPGRPPMITIDWRPTETSELLFRVADNGIGIPSDGFDRVFQIFQRLDTGESREGTGIGLAICKKIVEHHGGRIWVESVEGAGSTFFFTLPAAA